MENGDDGVECAECETSRAQIVCMTESLPYCIPCSSKLHSKKARSHHQLIPIPICSHCNSNLALVNCHACSQSQSTSSITNLPFCSQCMTSMHSFPLFGNHKISVLPILTSFVNLDTSKFANPITGFGIHQNPEKPTKNKTNPEKPTKNKVNPEKPTKNKVNPEKPTKSCPNPEKPTKNVPNQGKPIRNGKQEKPARTTAEKRKRGVSGEESDIGVACSKRPRMIKKENTPPEETSNNNVKDDVKRGVFGIGQGSPNVSTKRVFVPKQTAQTDWTCDYDEDAFSDFEDEFGLRTKLKGTGNISVEAFVVKAEDDGEEEEVVEPEGDRPGAGSEGFGIKERIRKILELWLHPDTPEHEAQQALKNAQRLLTKHNLKQAEVMNGDLKDSRALAGGMGIVELRSTANLSKTGKVGQWAYVLASVIATNFDTQYFTRKFIKEDRPLQVIFYGIKQNAECAGYAFAATFNRITVMSARFNPMQNLHVKKNKEEKPTNKDTLIARNNYKRGIVAGLLEAVKEVKKEGDNKPEQETKTVQALVLHSKEVGEAFIKKKGINITFKKGRPLKKCSINVKAFSQGVSDSKQIDINQRALPTSAKRTRKRRWTLDSDLCNSP